MPKASLRKIKSAPKFLVAVGVLLVIILGAAIFHVASHTNAQPMVYGQPQRLVAGKYSYTLEVPESESAKEKGLGERSSLPQNRGMLFPYDMSDTRCFWMKGMRFPLDIIWVDSQHKVTMIEPGLSPDTYPQAFCGTAQYVIELNSGQAARSGIKIGSQLSF